MDDLEPIGPIVERELRRLIRARNLKAIVDLRPPMQRVRPIKRQ
jgi:hypothetical protein